MTQETLVLRGAVLDRWGSLRPEGKKMLPYPETHVRNRAPVCSYIVLVLPEPSRQRYFLSIEGSHHVHTLGFQTAFL